MSAQRLHRVPDWVDERLSVGKSPTGANEDALAITADFIAVFDGMSSPMRSPGQRPTGALYSCRAAEAVAALPPQIGALDAIACLTAAVAGIDPDHSGPVGTATAIYSRHRGEIWRVGDIHVRIGRTVSLGGKHVDTAMTAFRAAVNAAHLASGETPERIRREDPGLQATRPLLLVQDALANSTEAWGYGIINGTVVPRRHVEVFAVPAGTSVVLASDGYPTPSPTLDAAEVELRSALAADPLCIDRLAAMGKAPQPGSAPDDRTYVRFTHHPSIDPRGDCST